MKIARWLWMIPLGMFAFSFALVPLYDVFCSTTGLNGKAMMARSKAPSNIDTTRTIKLEFSTTRNEQLPWIFNPDHTVLKVHPGAIINTSYFVKNLTPKTMIVQAVPSISPSVASKYLKKIDCFCFTQQSLKGGGTRHLPLIFYIDPDLPKEVHTLTLSYTLFDITDSVQQAS